MFNFFQLQIRLKDSKQDQFPISRESSKITETKATGQKDQETFEIHVIFHKISSLKSNALSQLSARMNGNVIINEKYEVTKCTSLTQLYQTLLEQAENEHFKKLARRDFSKTF